MYRPRIDAGVRMATRDGVTLTGDLYRPAEDGRWPVLLHRTPYDRRDSFRLSAIVAESTVVRPAGLRGARAGHPWPVRVRR